MSKHQPHPNGVKSAKFARHQEFREFREIVEKPLKVETDRADRPSGPARGLGGIPPDQERTQKGRVCSLPSARTNVL
jgi:hypothetical protein